MANRHVVVIGAGAAGLTAALRAGQAGARVTLLNAHPKPGLKILMSGGTRCNVTHREVSERDFHGGSRRVIARILRSFTVPQTLEWFERDLGMELKLEESGKYFPASDKAQAVLDALLAACDRAGVQIMCGARVVRLERAGARWRAGVQHVDDSAAFSAEVRAVGRTTWELPEAGELSWIAADAVVLATGGLSFPRTGSDGTGYALATALGHTLVPPVPALVPLLSTDPMVKAAKGVTQDVELTMWVGEKRVESASGPLLVTHLGYSGPAALDISRHWNRAAGAGERRVTANFTPWQTRETLLAFWLEAARQDPQRTVRRFLGGWVPDRIATEFAWEAEIDPARALAQVAKARREALLTRVTARDLCVRGTLGYEKAEVTAGGVPLAEVDPSTLESRVAPGLWLCGEVLDVEGRLGGFNFQWSWSSGTVAGRAAAASN